MNRNNKRAGGDAHKCWKKSSYASTKIEGNPLSQKQVDEVIENDGRKHYLKPEQKVRNYFLALNYLEEKANILIYPNF